MVRAHRDGSYCRGVRMKTAAGSPCWLLPQGSSPNRITGASSTPLNHLFFSPAGHSGCLGHVCKERQQSPFPAQCSPARPAMGAGPTGTSPAGCWHLSPGKGWKNAHQHGSLSSSEPVPCLNSTPQPQNTLSLVCCPISTFASMSFGGLCLFIVAVKRLMTTKRLQ